MNKYVHDDHTMLVDSVFISHVTDHSTAQINPFDAFGKTMIKNLELRGCPLLSISDYPTLNDQRKR